MVAINGCLFVVGKSQKPRCFGNYVPVRYWHNSKAWMTHDLFAKLFIEFNQKMSKKNSKVLLVLDNCLAHHEQHDLTAGAVLFLSPNATSKM